MKSLTASKDNNKNVFKKRRGFTRLVDFGDVPLKAERVYTSPKFTTGFTLLEIIIVISIVIGLFAIGAFIDIGMQSRRLLLSEQSTLVSIFEKARNQSMNNLYASSHGVHIDDDSYVIFKEFPYDENDSSNEIISRNKNISFVTDSSLLESGEVEVIFDQLSGKPNHTGQITFDNGKYIKIFSSGLIDW